jgi:hypothetical protein
MCIVRGHDFRLLAHHDKFEDLRPTVYVLLLYSLILLLSYCSLQLLWIQRLFDAYSFCLQKNIIFTYILFDYSSYSIYLNIIYFVMIYFIIKYILILIYLFYNL